jgi:phage-related protein
MSARVRARKAKVDPEFTFGFIRAQLEMFAPDYRYYTLAATSASLTPQLANGRIYNRTYNLVYTQALAGNAAATATINNSTGTAATGPYIVITGPVTNPQITNLATGSYIQLVGNFAAADTVVIDMTNNTVTRNNSNIRNLMTGGSQFFTVPAATSQQVYFSAATNTGWANVWYRPAFA